MSAKPAYKWLSPKEAAREDLEITEAMLTAWARDNLIHARRLGGGRGRWFILVGPDGLAVDSDRPRPRLAEPRFITLKQAVAVLGVTDDAIRNWVREGRVFFRRLAKTSRVLLFVMDSDGLLAEPTDSDALAAVGGLTPAL